MQVLKTAQQGDCIIWIADSFKYKSTLVWNLLDVPLHLLLLKILDTERITHLEKRKMQSRMQYNKIILKKINATVYCSLLYNSNLL